jgi:hypothetical protein
MKHKIVIEFETDDILNADQQNTIELMANDAFVQLETLNEVEYDSRVSFKNAKYTYSNDLEEKVDKVILEEE